MQTMRQAGGREILSSRVGTPVVMISPRSILEGWRRSRPDGASEHVHGLFPTSGPSSHGSHVQVASWVLPPYPSRQVSSAARALSASFSLPLAEPGARGTLQLPLSPIAGFSIMYQRQLSGQCQHFASFSLPAGSPRSGAEPPRASPCPAMHSWSMPGLSLVTVG
ncbi:hypothetical protein BO78DRAFT_58810 [Aspergillus sclerotiicarbonarius CBS 121057]|uniref:Uncharacterized protein n=1 Tax=Aspergillus sclerotiicarbonarius (strain CBS 121057 / IBT 28362) TaxID=1448318 RepID=A0A319EEE6_ASPSB|nr:hypothetical protein BO78DRAFT_58810 [Aspergillus sclerotiicarbonarius CBS 121057]